MVPILWKTGWQYLTKLKIYLAYSSAVVFLGIAKRNESLSVHKGRTTAIRSRSVVEGETGL